MAGAEEKPSELERTAARFDEVYTRMTGIQRKLIQAVREEAEDRETAELRDQAVAVLAAVDIALRTLDLGRPDYRTVEAAAVRARVLERPDPILLAPLLGATGRQHAYPILEEALGYYSERSQLDEAFGEHAIEAVLAMPRGMSLGTARKLARHHQLEPAASIVDLDREQLDQLRALIRDAASGLPDGFEDWRRRGPKSPPDGKGGGPTVLQVWLEELGSAEGVREQATQARDRDGWPQDAVQVAERIQAFTEEHVAGVLLSDWDRFLAMSEADRLDAMRAEQREARERAHQNDEDAWNVFIILEQLIEARKLTAKARRLLDGPEDEWGSSTPLQLSRTAGRRCGDLLSWCSPEAAAPLLEKLP